MEGPFFLADITGTISFLSFLKAVGPALGISVGTCIAITLGIKRLLTPHLYRHQLLQWADLHQESVQKVMMLGHCAYSIGSKLSPCPKCHSSDYQFWNFGKDHITYRCSTCHEIIRIRAFSNGQVRLILAQLPALLVVLASLENFSNPGLIRRLEQLCLPVSLYCERYFARREDRNHLKSI